MPFLLFSSKWSEREVCTHYLNFLTLSIYLTTNYSLTPALSIGLKNFSHEPTKELHNAILMYKDQMSVFSAFSFHSPSWVPFLLLFKKSLFYLLLTFAGFLKLQQTVAVLQLWCSASHCGGFSCCRVLAPGHLGFSRCGMRAQHLWLLGSRAQGQ